MRSTQKSVRSILTVLVVILTIGAIGPAQPRTTRAEERTGTSDDVEHGWTAPINISQSPVEGPEATWPTMDVSADGQLVYLAWSDRREVWQNIYYALSIDGGWHWSTAQTVAETNADSLRPSLAIVGATPAVAWADESVTGLTHTTYQWSLDTNKVLKVPNEHTWLASASHLVAGAGVPREWRCP